MPSPTDCVFSDSHEWHRISGDTLTLGISRYAVDALTDVTVSYTHLTLPTNREV